MEITASNLQVNEHGGPASLAAVFREGGCMFARIVSMPLKANGRSGFDKGIEKDVIPLLRRHKGFLDEIALVSADGKTGFAVSFWDSKENAEAYHGSGYGAVMKTLDPVIAGPAQVQLCEVTNSTPHKIAVAAGA
jgi:hypothetical protein